MNLYAIPLFQDISYETIQILQQHSEIQYLKKGSVLIRGRDIPGNILIQVSGKSMTYNLTRQGQRKIYYVNGPGSFLNDQVLGEGPSSIYCELLEDSRVLFIPKKIFAECLRADFVLTGHVMKVQDHKVRRLGRQTVNSVGAMRLERRLASKLWKLSRDFGIQSPDGVLLDLQISVSFLADLLGAPRENTSRILKKFSESGLIRLERKKLLILDKTGLEQLYKI